MGTGILLYVFGFVFFFFIQFLNFAVRIFHIILSFAIFYLHIFFCSVSVCCSAIILDICVHIKYIKIYIFTYNSRYMYTYIFSNIYFQLYFSIYLSIYFISKQYNIFDCDIL